MEKDDDGDWEGRRGEREKAGCFLDLHFDFFVTVEVTDSVLFLLQCLAA